ncbi:MAG: hypothetical protein HKN32_04115 [Flavobacteriales bacterium]|nr:hypothetical protein [Flavobacteriales bacterium]
MRILLTCVAALILSFNFNAQKEFEGTIKFDLEYLSLPEELVGMEAMLPTNLTKKIKGNQVRVEQSLPGQGDQIVIQDFEAKSGTVLMDILGNKVALSLSNEDFMEMESLADQSAMTKKKDKREIAGFKCKKMIIERDDFEGPVTIWYTEEYDTPEMDYGKIEGLVLEFTTFTQGMQLKATATSVELGTLEEGLFKVPPGYQEMSQQDLMQMFGQ